MVVSLAKNSKSESDSIQVVEQLEINKSNSPVDGNASANAAHVQIDSRIYMAAERTFLAWIRTGIALMGFGFVVARFGLFLRELALVDPSQQYTSTGFSLPIGIALIVLGMIVNLVSVVRHHRYIAAIDRNDFRSAFDRRSRFGLHFFLHCQVCDDHLSREINRLTAVFRLFLKRGSHEVYGRITLSRTALAAVCIQPEPHGASRGYRNTQNPQPGLAPCGSQTRYLRQARSMAALGREFMRMKSSLPSPRFGVSN